MSPGETPPKKSPIMLPIAEPHAAAGPNRKEQTIGIALAGRSSVTPGISGTTLNGTSTAAYSAAEIAHNTTIRVLRHISRSSLIADANVDAQSKTRLAQFARIAAEMDLALILHAPHRRATEALEIIRDARVQR